MTDDVPFITLQWQRGKGYYNAHEHDTPIIWESFNEALKAQQPGLTKVQRSKRYGAYLLSFALHHMNMPLTVTDVSTDTTRGLKILDAHTKRLNQTLEYMKEMKSVKGKQTKTRKGRGV